MKNAISLSRGVLMIHIYSELNHISQAKITWQLYLLLLSDLPKIFI